MRARTARTLENRKGAEPKFVLARRGYARCFRGGERDREFEFGAGVGLAPDAEAGADACGSFAHAGQAKVGLAAGVEELRVEAGAVVADRYAKLAGGIFELDFDLSCLGMAQGVEQGFAGDQVDLVQYGWIERSWAAHFYDADAGAVGGSEFSEEIREGLVEACGRGFGGAKTLKSSAAFGDSVAHQVAYAAQQGLGRGIGWQATLGDLELH